MSKSEKMLDAYKDFVKEIKQKCLLNVYIVLGFLYITHDLIFKTSSKVDINLQMRKQA